MQRPNIEAEWQNIAEKLMNRFPKLTPADLIYQKGMEDELIEKIGLKIHKTPANVLVLIATL